MSNSVLPEYVSDILPVESMKIEKMRRCLLDLFFAYGYELVRPPLVEFLESLLVDGRPNLDLELFKLVDQLSGRLMGLRTDFKPQVARMDASFFYENGISRLCHAGSVLYARPRDMQSTREPYRIGADIFGYSGIEADIEIHQLVIEALDCLKINHACFDLSDTRIVTSLLTSAELSSDHKTSLMDALSSRNSEKIDYLTQGIEKSIRLALQQLPDLAGDISILDKARQILPAHACDFNALHELEILAGQFTNNAVSNRIDLSIDLAPSNYLNYQSGPFFSVYVNALPNALINGGRYDAKKLGLGFAREATGFTLDLKELVKLFPGTCSRRAIVAPGFFSEKDKFFSALSDSKVVMKKLFAKIADLRKKGEVVIYRFPDQKHNAIAGNFDCDRHLVYKHDQWVVEKFI